MQKQSPGVLNMVPFDWLLVSMSLDLTSDERGSSVPTQTCYCKGSFICVSLSGAAGTDATQESNISLAAKPVWWRSKIVHSTEHIIPNEKQDGSSIMLWRCFYSAWTGEPVWVDKKIVLEKSWKILEENLLEAAKYWGRTTTLNTNKAVIEWFTSKCVC